MRVYENWRGALIVASIVIGSCAAGPLTLARSVTIRIYDNVGVPQKDVRAARQTADSIFRAAHVQLAWRECRYDAAASGTTGERCVTALPPGEVMVRMEAPVGGSDEGQLGTSFLIPESTSGIVSTVFPGRIAVAASRNSVQFSTLLGRVVAHEIGHLLLGTNSHSNTGIMRSRWPDPVLRARIGSHWAFSGDETTEMTRRLIARDLRIEASVRPGVSSSDAQ